MNAPDDYFHRLRDLLLDDEPFHPAPAAEADRVGVVLHHASAFREMPEGHGFSAPVEALHAAVLKHDAKYVARYDTEYGPRRLYQWRDGASFVRFREDASGVRECNVIAVGDAVYAEWREMVRAFAVKNVARPGTSVHVLARKGGEYGLRPCGAETATLIHTNYEPGVARALDDAARELVAKEPAGRLLLLEGPPGTGKTRAVRALIASLAGAARVVIVPPHLIADLGGPDLLGALLGHPTPTVLVIEDADYALLDRSVRHEGDQQGSAGALASVLNLSDGILGAQVDLRLVATTNARVERLDAAVLRPGRLMAQVYFGALGADQARAVVRRELSAECEAGTVRGRDLDDAAYVPMTLTECYAVALRLRREARERSETALPTPD